jgi:hypothetical protein
LSIPNSSDDPFLAFSIDPYSIWIYIAWDRTAEGCKLGFNSIILFEKSLIFKAMIEFNEIRRYSKFRKNLELFLRYHPETAETAQI